MKIEVFNLASEDTLISLVVFSTAFFFFLYQRIKLLKKRIAIYEETEDSNRQSLQRDLNRMNDIIEDLKYEYVNIQDSIERELVEIEMGNLNLQPKMADFQKTMANYSQKMQKILEQLEMGISSIHKKSRDCETQDLSTPLSILNNNLSTAMVNLERVTTSCMIQSDVINELSNDFALIKRGHGLE